MPKFEQTKQKKAYEKQLFTSETVNERNRTISLQNKASLFLINKTLVTLDRL